MGTHLPPEKRAQPRAQVSAHVYCVQTAEWMKTPLGMEVDLGPGHIVRRGPSSPIRKGHSIPSVHVYYDHGHPSQLLLSSCNTLVRIIRNHATFIIIGRPVNRTPHLRVAADGQGQRRSTVQFLHIRRSTFQVYDLTNCKSVNFFPPLSRRMWLVQRWILFQPIVFVHLSWLVTAL